MVCDVLSSACPNDCLAVIQKTKKLEQRDKKAEMHAESNSGIK